MNQMKQKVSDSILGSVLLNRNFWIAMMINLTNTMARNAIKQPVNIAGKDLGMTATALGLIASVYTIVALLARTPFGRFMDQFDKRKVLTGAYLFQAFSYALFGLTHSVPAFILCRLMQGASFGMAHLAMTIVMGAAINKKALGSALGLLTLLPKLAGSVTILITVWISDLFGTEYSFFAGAALTLICVLFTWLLKFPEGALTKKSAKEKAPFSLKNFVYWKALPMATVQLLVIMPAFAIEGFLILYAKEIGIGYAAVYISLYTACMGFGGAIAGFISDKFGVRSALYPTVAMAAVSTAIVGLTTNYSLWIISAVMLGIANGAIAPVTRSSTISRVSLSQVSLAMATFAMMQDLGNIISTVLSGVMIDVIGYSRMFSAFALFPAIALVMCIVALPKLLGKDERTEEVKVSL